MSKAMPKTGAWKLASIDGRAVRVPLTSHSTAEAYFGDKRYAQLAAAAPDLYAALKAVIAISDRKHDAWDAAKAALAKAEGRA